MENIKHLFTRYGIEVQSFEIEGSHYLMVFGDIYDQDFQVVNQQLHWMCLGDSLTGVYYYRNIELPMGDWEIMMNNVVDRERFITLNKK